MYVHSSFTWLTHTYTLSLSFSLVHSLSCARAHAHALLFHIFQQALVAAEETLAMSQEACNTAAYDSLCAKQMQMLELEAQIVCLKGELEEVRERMVRVQAAAEQEKEAREREIEQRERMMVEVFEQKVEELEVDVLRRVEEAREGGFKEGRTIGCVAEKVWESRLDAAVAQKEIVIVSQAQENQSLKELLCVEKEGQSAHVEEQAARDAELKRLQSDMTAKETVVESLSARLNQVMGEVQSAQQQSACAMAQAEEAQDMLETIAPLPAQLISTLQQVIRCLKERREDREKAQQVEYLEMSNERLALREALGQSEIVVKDAEEYSGQLEQRLEAALHWRQQVEEQVQQQCGENETLHKHLGILKTALDMSPSATPSKGVAKVGYLKQQVQSALEQVQAEAIASQHERDRRAEVEQDLGMLHAELERMQVELVQQQHLHQNQRAAMATECADARELRSVLETQIQQMQGRVVGLQKTLDNYQTQDAARSQAGEELVQDREKMLRDADDTIAHMRAQLQSVLEDKEAKQSQALKMQQHLESVDQLLAQENARVRESQAQAEQLHVVNQDLTSKLDILQAHYQQACLQLLGNSSAAGPGALANISHISNNVTPPCATPRDTVQARHSGVHETVGVHESLPDSRLSFQWEDTQLSADVSPQVRPLYELRPIYM